MQMLFVAIAGWMNREQQAIIEYRKGENRVFLGTAWQAAIAVQRQSKTSAGGQGQSRGVIGILIEKYL